MGISRLSAMFNPDHNGVVVGMHVHPSLGIPPSHMLVFVPHCQVCVTEVQQPGGGQHLQLQPHQDPVPLQSGGVQAI